MFAVRFVSLYWFAEDYDVRHQYLYMRSLTYALQLLDDEVVVNSFFAGMIREVWRTISPILWISMSLQVLCLIVSAILFHLKVNGSGTYYTNTHTHTNGQF